MVASLHSHTGCLEINQIHSYTVKSETGISFGFCYLLCINFLSFAYQKSTCYCLNITSDKSCDESFNAEQRTATKVYTVAYNVVEQSSDDMCMVGRCLYSANGLLPNWSSLSCNSVFPVDTICENGQKFAYSYYQKDAVMECELYHSSMLPRNLPQFCREHGDIASYFFWLPINRTIYNYTVGKADHMPNVQSLKSCRFQKWIDGIYYQENGDCLAEKRVVCSSVQAISKYSSQSSTSFSVRVNTESDGGTVLTTNAGFGDDYTNTNSVSGSLRLGPLVGGSIGGILIIVLVIVVIIIIRKKRNAQPSEAKVTKTPITVSNMQNDLAETIPSNIFTGNTCTNEAQNRDELYSLQRLTPAQYSAVDISRHFTNDDVYNTASKGEYDKLNNVSSRHNTRDLNNYGIIGQCDEGEYDTPKGTLQGGRTEDLYDTNVPVYGGKGDSTYDSANSFHHRQMDRNSTYGYSPSQFNAYT